jgi:hypothetical protein
MTTLRFKARDGHLVPVPGSGTPGQMPRYVGLQYDHDAGEYKPAIYQCEANSPEGFRLMKLIMRDKSIEAADAETAAACGIMPLYTIPDEDSDLLNCGKVESITEGSDK